MKKRRLLNWLCVMEKQNLLALGFASLDQRIQVNLALSTRYLKKNSTIMNQPKESTYKFAPYTLITGNGAHYRK